MTQPFGHQKLEAITCIVLDIPGYIVRNRWKLYATHSGPSLVQTRLALVR